MKQVARRAGWGITDQLASSLTNFALTIVIARAFSPTAFGAFTVAYLLYVLLLQLCRTLTSQPLVVRYSAAPNESCREGAARAVGLSLVVGVVAGVAIAVCALGFSGQLRSTLLALAVVLPGLLVQDSWRFAFFAMGRPALALGNDVAWAGIQFPLLAVLLFGNGSSVSDCVFAWGGAASASAFLGSLQAGFTPSISGSTSWLRQHSDLSLRYAGEFLVERASFQVASFAVGIVAGLAALGSLRAALVLMGPLTILVLSVEVVAVPETVRLLDRSKTRFRQSVKLLSVALTVVSLAWGTLLLLLPDGAGQWLLGANWDAAHPLLIPVTLATAATAASMGPWTALRALQAATASLRVRTIIAPIAIIASLVGALLGAALGAAIGSAIARWLAVVFWWREYGTQLRRKGLKSSSPAPHPSPRAAPALTQSREGGSS